MLFIKFISYFIVAYIVFWKLINFLIGLPGMGLGMALLHLAAKREFFLKKTILLVLGFFSYILNFTLNAFVWGFIVCLFTITILIDASHPMFYFFFGAILSIFMIAPSGETDILTIVQSLSIYLFFASGKYLEFLALLGNSSPSFLNIIWII